MARRNNNGVFEDLFGIARMLPWWASVVLAVVAYGILHRYAIADVPTNVPPGQIGSMVVAQMVKAFATYGQYIVPTIVLAGALASYFEKKKRERLIGAVAADASGKALNQMSWREFEMLVGQAFRADGYTVTEVGGGGADGGVDLQLRKSGEIFLVQCKQWKAYKVSVKVVRELYGVMTDRGAAGGFVVTSGVFTSDAAAFARGKNIELVDGASLLARIRKNEAIAPSPALSAQYTSVEPMASSAGPTPACPKCGAQMLQRIAKQGANVGKAFWGCEAFPKCRGVRGL
ncbi:MULTISPECIES: restriction endonuclease [Cupriavidus]|jgi:restriction system protein|uniref:restriction endonuclease n=1 Tax=unclassified Cupriavidus TaxID=2640874 RepID=UPI003F9306A4